MQKSFTQDLTIEFAKILSPLSRLDSEERVIQFLFKLGWQVPDAGQLVGQLGAIVDAAQTLVEAIADPASGNNQNNEAGKYINHIEILFKVVKEAINGSYAELGNLVGQINGLIGETNGLPGLFLERFNNYLFYSYLENHQPKLFAVLHFLAVVEIEEDRRNDVFFRIRRVHWDRLPKLITGPIDNFEAAYNWGPNLDFNDEEFLRRLHLLIRAFLLPGGIYPQNKSIAQTLGREGEDNTELRIPIRQSGVYPNQWSSAGINVSPLSPRGIFIYPALAEQFSFDFDLGHGWEITFNAVLEIMGALGLIIRPPAELEIKTNDTSALNLELIIEKNFNEDKGLVLLGSPDDVHLAIEGVQFKVFLTRRGSETDIGFSAGMKPLALNINGSETDGFIRSFLPSSLSRIKTDLSLGYTLKKGFNLDGYAVLTFRIPIERGLWLLRIIDLSIELGIGSKMLTLGLGTTLQFNLGPIKGMVQNIGLNSILHFPGKDDGGRERGWEVEVGFKPPTGIGISIQTGILNGEGLISHNPQKGQYVGMLRLELFSYWITGIGILNTKDSSGKDLPAPGFSFLIILTAENLMIQLGFGFILNGVGGLIGIHRTIDTKALEEGLNKGVLNSILFPRNPLENMPRIVADIESVFPTAMDHVVVGPMVQITWGVPTIFSIELGIILKFPDPVIVLLGKLHSALPSESAPIIIINCYLIGILDFDRKFFMVRAAIKDSRLALFELYGGFVFLLDWGDRPNFILSIGGFHPDYRHGGNLPEVDRLGIALGLNDILVLRVEGYFAVTSNSIQFGARAEAFLGVDEANIHGWLEFDVLITFSPFYFSFHFSVGLVVSVFGMRLAGITFTGTLVGPSPLRIWGEGCVSILFIDICLPFDFTIIKGRKQELPEKDPWPELQDAIEETSNWEVLLPSFTRLGVVVSIGNKIAQDLVMHPAGSLKMRQRVLPFERKLERFGEYRPASYDEFKIKEIKIGGRTLATDRWVFLKDYFAGGHYEELTVHEKMSKPPFEEMESGFHILPQDPKGDQFKIVDESKKKERLLTYEQLIIDLDGEEWQEKKEDSMSSNLELEGAIASRYNIQFDRKSMHKSLGTIRPKKNPFSIKEKQYKIVSKISGVAMEELELNGIKLQGLSRAELVTNLKAISKIQPHLKAGLSAIVEP